MNIEYLLMESLQLLVLGMGSVFVILVLLIGVIKLASSLLKEAPQTDATPAHTGASGGQPPQEELVAVIQAAIHRHRKAT